MAKKFSEHGDICHIHISELCITCHLSGHFLHKHDRKRNVLTTSSSSSSSFIRNEIRYIPHFQRSSLFFPFGFPA